jgi:hypothetical protein
MKVIYDIRQQIPQFSANFFTPYNRDEHGNYPRMMVDKTNPDFLKPYKHKNGKEVVVNSAEEEAEFWASLEAKKPVVEAPKAIDVLVAAPKPIERHQFEAITPVDAAKAETKQKRKYTRKLPA